MLPRWRAPRRGARSGALVAHLPGVAPAFGDAHAAALAVVLVDPVARLGALDDGVRAIEQAGIAARAVAAREAALRLLRSAEAEVHFREVRAPHRRRDLAVAVGRHDLEVGEPDLRRCDRRG